MPESDREAAEGRPERVGDALRSAVERTLAATAGSAAETRQRAEELLNEVTRAGAAARDEVGRRGEAAREEVVRRREAAKVEVSRRGEEASGRLADVIAELKLADTEDVGALGERIRELEQRLGSIERVLRGDRTSDRPEEAVSKPQPEPEEGPQKGSGKAKSSD